MKNLWKQFLEFLLPTPRICPICHKQQSQLMICENCLRLLETKRQNHGQCQRCGTFGYCAGVCDNCRVWPNYLQRNISAMPYDGLFREVILDFKHRHRPWLANILAELLAPLLPQADIIIPVPLHPIRLSERGYNQSALLGAALSKQLFIPMREDILLRTRNTPHQTNLSRTARIDNLHDAFIVRHQENIKGKQLILLDDVLTTGTTIMTCAKTLHQAGAASIISATLASGLR